MGVTIMPPMVSYYHMPETIIDVTHQMVGNILDSVDIDFKGFKRWKDMIVK